MTRQNRRSTRARGFSLVEVTVALGILGFGLLSLAAMQVHALQSGANGRQMTNAVAIARDQMQLVNVLPYTSVAPTAGSEAPSWIDVPGHALGELPVRVGTSGQPAPASHLFNVTWRVTNVDPTGDRRNVDIQVAWNDEVQGPRTYTLSSVIVR